MGPYPDGRSGQGGGNDQVRGEGKDQVRGDRGEVRENSKLESRISKSETNSNIEGSKKRKAERSAGIKRLEELLRNVGPGIEPTEEFKRRLLQEMLEKLKEQQRKQR